MGGGEEGLGEGRSIVWNGKHMRFRWKDGREREVEGDMGVKSGEVDKNRGSDGCIIVLSWRRGDVGGK